MKTEHKIAVIIFLVCLFLVSVLIAQENRENDQIQQFRIENQEIDDNEVYLKQSGLNNQSVVLQSSFLYNNGHDVFINQYGYSGQLRINQFGVNNRAHVVQSGSQNFVELSEAGYDISSKILQLGSDNKVFQELGSHSNSYRITQHGYDHEVYDLGFDSNNPGYTIKQEGLVGMKVIIEH
jgi:hypothetical protein